MRFGITAPSRAEFEALHQPMVPVTRRLLDLTELEQFNDQSQQEAQS